MRYNAKDAVMKIIIDKLVFIKIKNCSMKDKNFEDTGYQIIKAGDSLEVENKLGEFKVHDCPSWLH